MKHQPATLIAGNGWWDVTKYPYGGNFRRGKADKAVILTGETHPKCGWQFQDGDTVGWADPSAFRRELGEE